MKYLLRILLVFTIALTLLGWALDVVPGRLENVLFFPVLLTMFLFIVGGGFIAILGVPLGIIACFRHRNAIRTWFLREIQDTDWRPRVDRSALAMALAIPVVALLFISVVMAQIPAGVGFRLSRSAFEASVKKFGVNALTPRSDSWNVVDSGDRFGLYRVDKVGFDGRGGIYFRVNTGPHGIGPDRMSHGFAKKPNAVGSPFGRADYSVRRLVGDWYVFQASDDYF